MRKYIRSPSHINKFSKIKLIIAAQLRNAPQQKYFYNNNTGSQSEKARLNKNKKINIAKHSFAKRMAASKQVYINMCVRRKIYNGFAMAAQKKYLDSLCESVFSTLGFASEFARAKANFLLSAAHCCAEKNKPATARAKKINIRKGEPGGKKK